MRINPSDRLVTVNHEIFSVSHERVRFQLEHGHDRPWTMLRKLRFRRIYGDMVKSVIAAIYLDSGQNLDACESFVRRLGLLHYCERMINEHLYLRNHPPRPEGK